MFDELTTESGISMSIQWNINHKKKWSTDKCYSIGEPLKILFTSIQAKLISIYKTSDLSQANVVIELYS